MKFNKKEYVKLLIYILSNCYDKPHVGKTVLLNTLYFADFNHYEIYNDSITHETYLKSKKGVQSKHFEKITNELIKKDHLFFRKEAYYHRTLHKYYLTKIPNINFSKEKLLIINSTINELITKNATTIMKHTKDDPPYKIAKLNEELDYENVYYRNPNYSIRKKFIYSHHI